MVGHYFSFHLLQWCTQILHTSLPRALSEDLAKAREGQGTKVKPVPKTDVGGGRQHH